MTTFMVTSESEAEAAAATWDPSAWGMASVPRSSKAMRNNDIDILAAMAQSPQKLLSCVCSNLQPTGWNLNTGRGCFVLPCLLGIKKFNRRDCGMQGPSWNLWSWLILSRCKTPRSNLLRKVRNLSFCRLSQILLPPSWNIRLKVIGCSSLSGGGGELDHLKILTYSSN